MALNETAREALRQDVRELRAEGFPISRSQLAYLKRVAEGHAVWARITRYGCPKDATGARIAGRAWIEVSWKNPRWINGAQPTRKKIVRETI